MSYDEDLYCEMQRLQEIATAHETQGFWGLTFEAACKLDLDVIVVGVDLSDSGKRFPIRAAVLWEGPLMHVLSRGVWAEQIARAIWQGTYGSASDVFQREGWLLTSDSANRKSVATAPWRGRVPALRLAETYAHAPAELDAWPIGQAPGEREAFSALLAKWR